MGQENNIYRIMRKMADGLVPSVHRHKVLRWLFGGKQSKAKDKALFRLWNETDGNDVSMEETYRSLLEVKRRLGLSCDLRKKSFSFRPLLKYAAMFLLPLLIGVGAWFVMDNINGNDSNMVECYVPNGEQKKFVLSDGTIVVLNSGSLFVYPEKFIGKERRVFLYGEGHFDVTKNKKHPFIVRTGKLNVRVLGTNFNVEAYPDSPDMTVTLKNGKVQVYNPESVDDGIFMKPNEKLVYNPNDGFQLSKVNPDDYMGWTEGKLVFIQKPLSGILKTLERRYNVSYSFDGNINLKELYTVSFKQDETIGQVMRVMSALIGNNANYDMEGNNIYLYLKKKGGNRK